MRMKCNNEMQLRSPKFYETLKQFTIDRLDLITPLGFTT